VNVSREGRAMTYFLLAAAAWPFRLSAEEYRMLESAS